LPGPSAQRFTLVRVNSGDSLGWVHLTDGKASILLATADGMAICFSEDEVRPMGLVAAGVIGIKLQQQDEVTAAEPLPPRSEVLVVASDGTAKRMAAALFPRQGRYGQGVIVWKLPKNVRLAGMLVGKSTSRATLLISGLAPKPIRSDEAPLQTRTSRGKLVIELKPVNRVRGLVLPREIPRPLKRAGSTPAPRKRSAAKGRSGKTKT
jgi:DNA gyrase/topoisomerase IV subunit A